MERNEHYWITKTFSYIALWWKKTRHGAREAIETKTKTKNHQTSSSHKTETRKKTYTIANCQTFWNGKRVTKCCWGCNHGENRISDVNQMKWVRAMVRAIEWARESATAKLYRRKTANRFARKYLFEKLLNKTWTMRKIVNLTVLLDGCCLLQLPFFFTFYLCCLPYALFVYCVSRCFITLELYFCASLFLPTFSFGFGLFFLRCACSLTLQLAYTQLYAVLFVLVFRISHLH